jgi:hypothetical protein
LLLLTPLLSGCFTMTLWGFEPVDEVDPFTGKEETVFEYDEATEWSWQLFFTRLGLTPFALVLDAATCPVQAVVFGMDCDDDDDPPR